MHRVLVGRLLDAGLAAIVVAIAVVVVIARGPSLVGASTLVVRGPSMEPAIPLGAAIVVTPVAPESIRVGDVVTIGQPGATPYTHRVSRLVTHEGAPWLETKGDANGVPEPVIVPATAVVGRVGLVIPYVGYLIAMLALPAGLTFVLGLLATIVLGRWLLELAPDVPAPPPAPATQDRDEAAPKRHRRRRHVGRLLRPFAVVVLAGGLVGTSTHPVGVLARLTDAAAGSGSFRTDTLDPPTGLSATGGTGASLSWTPTVDAYASGYRILRSTSSSGPFAQVGTATPRSAPGYSESPSPALYYYVVRAYSPSWNSVDAGPVSANVLTGPTGFRDCAANVLDTGGDGNGYETSPASACVLDGAYAQDANSGSGTASTCGSTGKDRHRFWNFALPVASATAINGIEVELTGYVSAAGTNLFCVELSWNGGTSWTAAKSIVVSTTPGRLLLGGAADTWGRAWTASQLSDANFRLRITDVANATSRTFFLDHVGVQVTWTR